MPRGALSLPKRGLSSPQVISMFGFGKKKSAPPAAPAAPDATAPQPHGGGLLARLRGRRESVPQPADAGNAGVSPADPEPKPAAPVPQAPATTPAPAVPRPSLLEAARAEAAAAARHGDGFLGRLRERLARTRAVLNADVGDLLRGRKEIDPELIEELEALLLTADVGVPTTNRIVTELSARVARHELARPAALVAALREQLRAILLASAAPVRQPSAGRPQVILMVGVNGVGKTTTIGKLAQRLQQEGNRVMLAAGDTFRAAAVEQLQVWGARNQVPVIAQGSGADPASVIFDALQAATARGFDVLIADTAGRLHTKEHLMEELKKIARVMRKLDPEAPHETMLVVDATTGQNALTQALEFHRALPLTGITLTKLDGTAKGGILFALADRLPVPIRFIGVGEDLDDLRYFDPDEFLDALLTP